MENYVFRILLSNHPVLKNESNSFDGHITVALAAYNREDTIEEAVRSVLGQTYRNFDLYVVDDASTDGTFEIVQRLLPNNPRLHLVRLNENGGTYSAKNLVLKRYCKGEFYAHQDADDISWPRRLEAQVEYLRAKSKVAACGTGIDEFFKTKEDQPHVPSEYEPDFNEDDGHFHRKNIYKPIHPQGLSGFPEAYEYGCFRICMNGSVLFRSEAVKRIGGFDGRTPIGADVELLLRLRLFHDLGNLQEILYSRRFHQNSLTKSPEYGHHTPVRLKYFDKIFSRLAPLRPLLEEGQLDRVLTGAKEDMYSIDCDYEVFHGGEKVAKAVG